MIGRFLPLCLLLACGSPQVRAEEPAGRPNVLMILTDDQGWGDLSHSGNTAIRTPHIDSLARDGVFLKHFYVQPVCSPTRAEMLTGRCHTRTGVVGVSTGGERLNADEKTIADHFKAAGYATAAFGKWHNGTQWPYHPNARGFDEFYGFCSGHWGHYFSPQLEHNGEIVKGDGYINDDFTNHAIAFIEKHKGEPFFCYLPLNTPHSPMQVPDEFWERFAGRELMKGGKGEDVVHSRAALAMCENIDWNVGRLLDALKRLDLDQDTIVIYFSDNGPNGARWNGGLRGIKGSTDEGGVRSPCFMRWPGHFRKGLVVGEISGAIDLLPTLADACGVELKGGKPLDGVSLKPLLMGQRVDWLPRLIFNQWGKGTSVRSETHRLDSQGRLYDMAKDPGQSVDIAKDKPQITKDLIAARDKWLAETQTPKQDRPFTVGHSGSKLTLLPARDARAGGEIQRSSIHPNCSYFTHWTRAVDKVTWDVEVLNAGNYEAVLYYTCKQEDVGCEMKLSLADNAVISVISEAHDPPLQGQKENRVYKRESFSKDFRPHSMGRIGLPAGRAQLQLEATRITGAEAIELRALMLRRVE